MKKIGLMTIVISAFLAGCAGGGGNRFEGEQKELLTASDQTVSQKRALNHLNLAIGYYQQGQWNSALDDVKKALQYDAALADAYSMRALIYMEISEFNLAEENFLRALSLDPNNPDYSNNYGWLLCRNGRMAQSIPYFEAAINSRNYQSRAKAYNNAGVCTLKLKNESAAERYFLQAFQIEPKSPVSNVNLAKIYFDRKDYERARFYIARISHDSLLSPDVLWLAIKMYRKLGDRDAELSLITQLRKRYPDSAEYSAFRRGAFDE